MHMAKCRNSGRRGESASSGRKRLMQQCPTTLRGVGYDAFS